MRAHIHTHIPHTPQAHRAQPSEPGAAVGSAETDGDENAAQSGTANTSKKHHWSLRRAAQRVHCQLQVNHAHMHNNYDLVVFDSI